MSDAWAIDPTSVSVSGVVGLSGGSCDQLSAVPANGVQNLTSGGCFEMSFDFTNATGLDEYTLSYWTSVLVISFAEAASDGQGEFRMAIPPYSPAAPRYSWQLPPGGRGSNFSGWTQVVFPQDAWVKQSPDCVVGQACSQINIAPSYRYGHSAVVYETWNFERDVAGHGSLCRLPGRDNSACRASCLTNVSCTGAANLSDFFSSVSDSYFWTNPSMFGSDDGNPQPVADAVSASCPSACCGDRRLCLRTRDHLGQKVNFDESFMLVFGGQTRQKTTTLTGNEDLYAHCEESLQMMNMSGNATDQKNFACMQFISEELWRFSLRRNVWELLKPASTVNPSGRFAHAAALVVLNASNDALNTRRQYFFVFGGFSTNCGSQAICKDLWRYELPWAAQAYWPPAFSTGNTWTRLSDAPVALYRHSMFATADGNHLIAYGGQKTGAYSSQLLIYTLVSDSWQVKTYLGYMGFLRTGPTYLGGANASFTSTKMEEFIPGLDELIGPSSGGFSPGARADYSSVLFADSSILLMNGFATYDSPFPNAPDIPYPSYPYYPNNSAVWSYDIEKNVWSQLFASSGVFPSPRRGAACALLPFGKDDRQVVLVTGGARGDTLFGDFFIFDPTSRKWTPLDYLAPLNVSFHSLVFDQGTNQAIIFGGMTWTPSNLSFSDQLIGADRSCFTNALNLQLAACTAEEITAGNFTSSDACALAAQQADIFSKCNSSSSTFCCTSQFSAVTSLSQLSTFCSSECLSESFTTQYTANFLPGVFFFTPNASCANNCSSQGDCELGRCACYPGWTGSDCSLSVCEGSFCYFDSVTLNTSCVECSGNGQCESASGQCACNSGFSGSDCSEIACKNNCSNHNGLCFTDFPLNQCICARSFSSEDCSVALCLNDCSLSGACNPDGSCACNEGFTGPDCSVYLFAAAASSSSFSALLCTLLLANLVLT